MKKQTLSRTSTKTEADRHSFLEKRLVVSRHGAYRGFRGGRVLDRGSIRRVRLSSSISTGRSMTVVGEDRSRANMEGWRIASMETNHLEEMPSGSQSLLTKQSFVGLPTSTPNVAHQGLAESSELLTDSSVRENSRKTSFCDPNRNGTVCWKK